MLKKIKNLSFAKKIIIVTIILCFITGFLGFWAAKDFCKMFSTQHEPLTYYFTDAKIINIKNKKYLALYSVYYNHLNGNLNLNITQNITKNKLNVTIKAKYMYFNIEPNIGNCAPPITLIPLENINLTQITITNYNQDVNNQIINIQLKRDNNSITIKNTTGLRED